MKFNAAPFYLAIATLTFLVAPARASDVLDDYSSDDSGNYTEVLPYDPNGNGPQLFSVNGSDELQPTGNYSTGSPPADTGGDTTTTAFLWKGVGFSDSPIDIAFPGQSVSIDAVNINDYALVGLRFSTSDTSLVDSVEFGILGHYTGDDVDPTVSATSGNVYLNGGLTADPALTLDFTAGKTITETFARTGDDTFTYSLAGAALTSGPVTGNFTDANFSGKTVYFGPDFFEAASTFDQKADNLTFVPEPSTYALMLGGLALLGFCIRRKGEQFQA
jgi:hypothetical protein